MTSKNLLVDAGTGNLRSVENALRSLGLEITVTQDPGDLKQGSRVILPGVGAFGKFMEGLHKNGLDQAICDYAIAGDPILGICVGMQAFFQEGEEKGIYAGLGLLPGRVIRFPEALDLKVPQTGWNQIWFSSKSKLLEGIPNGAYVYFNHSYFCQVGSPDITLAMTDYGTQFTSMVHRDNVYGVQFHPEKSQKVGLKILSNFFNI